MDLPYPTVTADRVAANLHALGDHYRRLADEAGVGREHWMYVLSEDYASAAQGVALESRHGYDQALKILGVARRQALMRQEHVVAMTLLNYTTVILWLFDSRP